MAMSTQRWTFVPPLQPTQAERAAAARDHKAQERAGAEPRPVTVTSTAYISGIHPDHGEPVTYVPGEALPDWVVEALDRGGLAHNPAAGPAA